MKRLWALLIGMALLGAILFYWAGEDGRKVPEFRKLAKIEKQITYTGGLVTALNLGYNGPRKEVEELENVVIKSTEYMLSHFRDELEKRPTLHVRVLQDLAYQYGEYKQQYAKADDYRRSYEKIVEENKGLFTPERYRSIKLGALQGRSSMFFDQKKYNKVVEVNLKIIEQFPYSFQENTRTNLWIDAYTSIWHMYNDRIKDYDKALYYAKAIAIDPRELPKEKIGWLGDHEVSYEQKLENDAIGNKEKSDYMVQITYGTFDKHKEIQQLLVDDLKREENEYNCASYTEIYSRLTFPKYVEFLQDGSVKVLTVSMLEEINGTNRLYKRPEITEKELTKGWKRETRIIDDKELKRLFKRIP